MASAVQYQGPACDCFHEYGDYLADHVTGSLESRTIEDVGAFLAERGVPAELRSCHLVELGGDEVIGHVPVEVIADEPAVQGITLPGMPAGSPGMDGSKDGTRGIYGCTEDGETTVLAEL